MDDVTATFEFSSWLRKQRAAKNLTLRGLARETKLSHTTIADAEDGVFSYTTVKRLADYFQQPEQKILAMAGMLEQKAKDELADEIFYIVQDMDPQQKEVALALLRTLEQQGTNHDKPKRKAKGT